MRDGRRERGRRGLLVAELVNVEETALGADVRLAKVVDAVHDRGTACASDTVVVRLANAADGGDGRVCLEEVVLSEVWKRSKAFRQMGSAKG